LPVDQTELESVAPWRRKQVEEKKEEKIIKKKQVKEKRKEREIEVEEEEEEEEEREVAGRKIKAHRPKIREYDIDEEEYDEIVPFDATSQKQIPLNTSSVYSETTPLGLVAQIKPGDVVESKASVDLLTHSALVEEQIHAEEKEIVGEKVTSASYVAKKSIDTREAYEVSEQDVQSMPGQFEGSFKPTLSTAFPNFVSRESIFVQEVQLGDTSSTMVKEDTKEFKADVSLLPQEATKISEVEVSQREQSLDEFSIPKPSQATGTFTTKESLNVEEILHSVSESDLDLVKPSTVKGKVTIDTKESLIVEEVESETKPGKHLPEAFVPTEIATMGVIPQKSLTQSQMVAPETEGEYVPGRLPPAQKADFKVTTGESVIVSQTQSQDKENVFSKAPSPEKASASEDLILSEGVTVSVTDSQVPQNDFADDVVQKEVASVEILLKETFSTQTTLAVESEGSYEVGDKPNYKTADSTIICHEINDTSIVTAQESENVLDLGEKPTESLAETSIRPVESLTVSEVQATDVPADFKDYPKFKTDTAVSDIETVEATHITETNINEKESSYVEDKPEMKTAESYLTRPQDQVEVTELNYLESEKQLKSFELPESHKTKAITSHTLPTGVVEEVNLDYSAGSLDEAGIKPSQADFSQTPHTETVISEAVVGETFEDKEYEKPEGKQADLVVSPKESIRVSEVYTDDKEKEYVPGESPLTQQATWDIDTQRVASKTEVQADYSTEKLETVQPSSVVAESEQDTLESVQVTQCQTADKEVDEIKKIEFETKQVAVDLTEARQGPNVTQIITNEREEDYLPEPQPQHGQALPNITLQEVIVKSEVETVVHADEIQEPELLTGRAKKYAKPLQELIVTETNVVDIEKNLPKDIIPNKKSANVEIIPGQELSVTEIVTDHKEQPLEYSKPAESQANLNVTESQVALKEEVTPEISPGDFSRVSPEKQLAKAAQDLSHPLVQTQFTTGEKEGLQPADVKPDEKRVTVEFLETEGINVSEVTADYKEKSFEEMAKPEEARGEQSISSHVIATKTEVQPDDSIDKFAQPEVATKQATCESSLFESVITGQTMVQERESELAESKPDLKSASEDYTLGEGVSVTSVTPADKERDFKEKEAEMETAAPIMTPQDEVQVGETVATDTLGDYDRSSPTRATATQTQSELQSVINLEAVIGESESALAKDAKPEEKTAGVEFEESKTAVVSETVTVDKEKMYEQPEAVASSQASLAFDVQPVAETNIVVAGNITKDVVEAAPSMAKANVDQSTLESIIQSESMVQDSEQPFEKAPLDVKTATIGFREDTGVVITQAESNESETILKPSETPEGKRAEAGVDALELVVKTETDVNEGFKDLEVQKPETASAQSEFAAFRTAVNLETIPTESDVPLEIAKAETRNVVVSVNEGQSVIVETVMTNENEQDFVREATQSKVAETSFTDMKSVAQTFQTQPDLGVGEFKPEIKDVTTAVPETVPYNIVMQSEQIVVDKEDVFEKGAKPSGVIANVNLEPVEGISISEATLALKEDKFEPLAMPSERVAVTNIDVTHKVAEQTTTDVTADVQKIESKQPETQKASESEEALSSLIVSENLVEEKEVDFEGKFVPATTKVNVSLEEGRKVVSVSESLTQDREGLVKEFDVPKSQKATTGYDAKLVPEQTEVLSESVPEELVSEAPTKSTASVKQTPYEELVQSMALVQEKEESLDQKKDYITKKAEIGYEEGKIISTSEIVPAERESFLEEQRKPETNTASVNVVSNISMQSSEILTSIQLGDFVADKPSEASAVPEQNVLESLTQVVTEAVDSLGQFEGTFKPATKKADTKIDTLSEITTSETYTEGQADEFTKFEAKTEKATAEYDATKRPLQASEVLPSENVGEFKPESKESVVGNVTQGVLESVILSESIVHESEKDFDKVPEFDTKKAKQVIDEKSSVSIIDVTTEEKEKELVSEFSKEEKFGVTNITSDLTTSSKSEVVLHENIGKLTTDKPMQETAEVTESTLQGLIVSERTVQEIEVPFDKSPVEGKKGDLTIIPESHVSVTEVTTTDKETEFEKMAIFKTSTAEKSISSQEAPQVQETTVQEGLTQLTTEVPDKGQALEEHVPHSTVSITEITSTEKEGDFKDLVKPTTQMAAFELEETRRTASTAQVVTEEKEMTFEGAFKFKTSTADKIITPQEVPLIEEVRTEEDVTKLKTDVPDQGQALEEHIPHKTVSITEITSTEKESDFRPGDKPATQLAELEWEGTKTTASTAQVLTQEKEITFEETVKFKTSKADKTISAQEATVIEEVLTSQDIEKLKTEVPDKGEALEEHIPHSTVNITEVTSSEREGDYRPGDKPVTQSAALELEETRRTASSAQVMIQEKESSFEGTVTFKTSKADKTVTPQEVPLIEEVTTEEDVTKLKTEAPEQEKASGEHIPHSTVSITEITSTEKEKDFRPGDKPATQLAELELEETRKTASTAQVITQEKEGLFEESQVKSTTADKTISPQEAPLVEETRIEEDLGRLKTEVPDKGEAQSEHVPHSTVSVTEVTSEEKEGVYRPGDKPATQLAGLELEETRKTASTAEVVTEEKESTFEEATIKSSKADKTVSPQEAPQVEETTVQEDVGKFKPEAPSTQLAEFDLQEGRKVGQGSQVKTYDTFEEFTESTTEARRASTLTIPLEGVVQSTVTLQGTTEKIKTEETSFKTASVDILLKEGLTVTEVNVQGQLGKEITQALAMESTAQEEIVHRPVSVKEEMIPLQSSDEFTTEKPKLTKAQRDLTEKHGLIVTDMKSTGNLESIDVEKAASKTVKVVLEDNSASLEISEVQLQEREGEFLRGEND
jgi:titin